MDVTIPYRFKVLANTAAALAADPGIPRERELVFETDTGFFKIGNGSTAYNSLPYAGIYPSSSIPYDNTTSGLSATNVKAAIDELAADVGGSAGTDLSTTARLYDECSGNAVTQAGWVSDISGGNIFVQQDVAGMNGVYKLSSGASSGQRAAISHGGFFCEVGGGEIRLAAKARPEHTPGGSQQSDYWIGFNSGAFGAGDTIRVRANDTSGGWILAWACAGGTPTSGTSVIPGTITGSTTQLISLVIAADGLSVTFYLDGAAVDTLTLPTGFLSLKPVLASRKNGVNGASSSLWVDKVLVEQDR